MSLFQTDAWQSAWWDTWGKDNDLIRVVGWSGGHSGLYLSRYRLKGLLPVSSLEFVGCSYRLIRSVRTEYNALPLPSATPDLRSAALDRLLESTSWSEAVFSDVPTDSDDLRLLKALAWERGWRLREAARDTAWHVDTCGRFDSYLAALGRNTRLRLFNRRKLLEGQGIVTEVDAWQNGPEGRDGFFRLLNNFHRQRWGKPVFGAKALGFQRLFLDRIVNEGGEPHLSILQSDGTPISVLYNVRYQGCTYNIQSGFQESFHPKLSLGILHLGYAIEASFRDPGVRLFDMLAGNGKSSNYKQHLANRQCELVSVMVVKNPLLKALYALKDRRASREVMAPE
ncbi:MAG: GNAT family N-acetyltransferase [Pseudomonadota bacterium]|nr:GNAT family N-acetyltransferase [Pseudomonadota bacterium]